MCITAYLMYLQLFCCSTTLHISPFDVHICTYTYTCTLWYDIYISEAHTYVYYNISEVPAVVLPQHDTAHELFSCTHMYVYIHIYVMIWCIYIGGTHTCVSYHIWCTYSPSAVAWRCAQVIFLHTCVCIHTHKNYTYIWGTHICTLYNFWSTCSRSAAARRWAYVIFSVAASLRIFSIFFSSSFITKLTCLFLKATCSCQFHVSCITCDVWIFMYVICKYPYIISNIHMCTRAWPTYMKWDLHSAKRDLCAHAKKTYMLWIDQFIIKSSLCNLHEFACLHVSASQKCICMLVHFKNICARAWPTFTKWGLHFAKRDLWRPLQSIWVRVSVF